MLQMYCRKVDHLTSTIMTPKQEGPCWTLPNACTWSRITCHHPLNQLLLLQEQQERNMLQPMTLEADRGPSTRGAMLDPAMQQEPKLRLEIGICGITKPDGTEVLEVRFMNLVEHAPLTTMA